VKNVIASQQLLTDEIPNENRKRHHKPAGLKIPRKGSFPGDVQATCAPIQKYVRWPFYKKKRGTEKKNNKGNMKPEPFHQPQRILGGTQKGVPWSTGGKNGKGAKGDQA